MIITQNAQENDTFEINNKGLCSLQYKSNFVFIKQVQVWLIHNVFPYVYQFLMATRLSLI